MKHKLQSIGLAFVMSAALAVPGARAQNNSGQAAPKPPEPLKLKVGDTAPDFTLIAFDGQSMKPYSLHDFKGKKNVALAFYVFAFTGG